MQLKQIGSKQHHQLYEFGLFARHLWRNEWPGSPGSGTRSTHLLGCFLLLLTYSVPEGSRAAFGDNSDNYSLPGWIARISRHILASSKAHTSHQQKQLWLRKCGSRCPLPAPLSAGLGRAGNSPAPALLLALRRLTIRLEASAGSIWAPVVGIVKAPEMLCFLYSLTFHLGEESPVLKPCTHSRAAYWMVLPPNPISHWLILPSSERRVLYTHRCISLGIPTQMRRPRERCYSRDTHLEGN